MALLVLLAIAFATDVRTLRIPNWLTTGGALTGILLQLIQKGLSGLVVSGTGMLAGFIAVLALFAIGAVGGGDVKLFGAIGALSSASYVLSALTYSIMIAACIGFILIIAKKKLLATVQQTALSVALLISLKDKSVIGQWKHEANMHIPFMLAVVPGCLAAYLQGA